MAYSLPVTIYVGVHEAKTNLPRLISAVERSLEEVLITRHGKPVARLVPVTASGERLADDLDPTALRRMRLHAAKARVRETLVSEPPSTEEVVAMVRQDRERDDS